MIKRKLLGQHFLNSKSIAEFIVNEARITKTDVVFEIGTGLGILTPLLCEKAQKVISVDADENLIKKAKSEFSRFDNLILKTGDGFKQKDIFSIFVSNLPYSRSKDAIEWLAQNSFSHGIIMVQKEFAEKLIATSKNRRAISIIASYTLDIKKISDVGKNNFSPPPKIDSVILRITKKTNLDKNLISIVNDIFSYRRKTIKNILKQFNKQSTIEKRVDDLSGDEIINLAKQIHEK
ncbi:MAG: rRNA adenine N(6)-methyltransferase family protein [Candidatus Nitrosopumilus limneticus]|nr:Dimethyladenosine transferase [Candidatus Nitrosopumilus limneticus]MDC4212154.1 rRNA adenine N(6)-methyltransferase family protein [Candidatus Nitrosopumilus limneticus]MDC4213611.1 rRNA adenine N(6)-methyltransferase family protein [Candidatus Nitrosopumilus limneticus]MDC4215195.1 rRNA adenine N(6)-methyltransferase family protein [Candidatus Nitrosopumilus limneticus]MDC4216052.1 rRNA adenine N(6)-methyltransferase family protein [Candidatus Nitrosopumilus limneticus]